MNTKLELLTLTGVCLFLFGVYIEKFLYNARMANGKKYIKNMLKSLSTILFKQLHTKKSFYKYFYHIYVTYPTDETVFSKFLQLSTYTTFDDNIFRSEHNNHKKEIYFCFPISVNPSSFQLSEFAITVAG